MKTKLKICGMKHNTLQVANLQPDYLGFIFYEGSKRNFEGKIAELPSKIKRVGVFVNASTRFILDKIKEHKLDVIQLHGEESTEFCKNLKTLFNQNNTNPEIWKVFSIGNTFNFSLLKPYEKWVDKFLFDTKGKEKGGNGEVFNWSLLQDYPSKKPFVLSGGIGMEQIDALNSIIETNLPIYAIDINSRFEDAPGVKNVIRLNQFINAFYE